VIEKLDTLFSIMDSYYNLVRFRKADMEVQNSEGKTPFLIAAEGGHMEILDKLIKSNVNGRVIDTSGNNALHLIAKQGHVNCLKVTYLYIQSDKKCCSSRNFPA